MSKDLVIIGSGAQAKYAISIVEECGSKDILGIADIEDANNVGLSVEGVPIICTLDEVFNCIDPQSCEIIIADGANDRKKRIAEKTEMSGFSFYNAVSPYAYVAASAQLGAGCIINAHSTIMPGATVRDHVVVHGQAVIEHDDEIESYVNISPGVSMGGNIFVGEGSYIYTGANIIPKVKIGEWTIVAAGATVIRDVPDYDIVAGVPALSIKH